MQNNERVIHFDSLGKFYVFTQTLMHVDISCNRIEDDKRLSLREKLKSNRTLTAIGMKQRLKYSSHKKTIDIKLKIIMSILLSYFLFTQINRNKCGNLGFKAESYVY